MAVADRRIFEWPLLLGLVVFRLCSREFVIGDREEIILHFVHAAERAQEVGMDFIEIHGTDQNLLNL